MTNRRILCYHSSTTFQFHELKPVFLPCGRQCNRYGIDTHFFFQTTNRFVYRLNLYRSIKYELQCLCWLFTAQANPIRLLSPEIASFHFQMICWQIDIRLASNVITNFFSCKHSHPFLPSNSTYFLLRILRWTWIEYLFRVHGPISNSFLCPTSVTVWPPPCGMCIQLYTEISFWTLNTFDVLHSGHEYKLSPPMFFFYFRLSIRHGSEVKRVPRIAPLLYVSPFVATPKNVFFSKCDGDFHFTTNVSLQTNQIRMR